MNSGLDAAELRSGSTTPLDGAWRLIFEVVATPAPDIDLHKLTCLSDPLNQLEAGRMPPADASTRLDAIAAAPRPWGKLALLPGYAFVGLGLAPRLGGSWYDTVCALKNGYSEEDCGKILGGNMLRVFQKVWH